MEVLVWPDGTTQFVDDDFVEPYSDMSDDYYRTHAHVPKGCTREDCDGTCHACSGLIWCEVCGGTEGSLPSECPNRMMTEQENDDVYAGKLDFIHGRWNSDGKKKGWSCLIYK